jgi:hypothetical protein
MRIRDLHRAIRNRILPAGGGLPRPRRDPDRVHAILSPARSTRRRPGESWTDAMERLLHGDDL